MSLLRIFKGKGNVFIVVFICSAIFFLSALLPSSKPHIKKPAQQDHYRQPASTNKYSRITDDKKLQLLYSALGHIQIGYVANKTPDVDTPPLLVMYSCKSSQMPCGSWGKRLLDITHAYYFSMLVDGTAFTADMSDPVDLQAYFEPHPGFMALPPSQAYYYIQQMDKNNERQDKVRNLTMQTMTLDPNINYVDHFKQGQPSVRILQTTQWPLNSISTTFQTSPHMKQLRDKYRLNDLPAISDWFWLVYRLLFNPSGWLATHLEPHRMLMGGSVTWGNSLSLLDPRNQLDSTVASSWFRIGLRLDQPSAVDCWLGYIEQLCLESKKEQCHLFVSATSPVLLDNVKRAFISTGIIIHTVADNYAFTTMGQQGSDMEQQLQLQQRKKKALFESDEQHSKSMYARQVMDWTILSRMDYLLGSTKEDDFIKTAAWAAQVQTDILVDQTSCQINSMMEW